MLLLKPLKNGWSGRNQKAGNDLMSRCDDAVDECSQDSDEACDSTTATCPHEFDISVELRGDSDARTLTPLMIQNYDELGSGTTHNLDFVDFELEI